MSTREKALAAAVELLGTQGIRSLTHGRVDAAAGIPRGSTSNYFRTRAALVAGVVEWIAEQELLGVQGPADLPETEEGLVDLLAGAVEALTGPFRVRTAARYVLFLEGTHDDEVRRPLLEGRARFRALAEAALARLGAADPAAAATPVMAVCEGMILHRLTVDPDADVRGAIEIVVLAAAGSPAAGD